MEGGFPPTLDFCSIFSRCCEIQSCFAALEASQSPAAAFSSGLKAYPREPQTQPGLRALPDERTQTQPRRQLGKPFLPSRREVATETTLGQPFLPHRRGIAPDKTLGKPFLPCRREISLINTWAALFTTQKGDCPR